MGGMSTEQIHRWELDWTFGDRLRKARRVLGITVDELARSLDVSKQAVSQWETGATIPRSVNAVARRLELAYGIPAAWLLGQEVPAGPDPDGGAEDPPARHARTDVSAHPLVLAA